MEVPGVASTAAFVRTPDLVLAIFIAVFGVFVTERFAPSPVARSPCVELSPREAEVVSDAIPDGPPIVTSAVVMQPLLSVTRTV